MKYLYIFIFIMSFPFSFTLAQEPEIVLPVGHNEGLRKAEYGPNGNYVLTLSYDNTAIIWDAVKGSIIYRISNPDFRVLSGRFISNGSRFYLVCTDNILRFYETATLKNYLNLDEINLRMTYPTLSPGGNYILELTEEKTYAHGM